VPRSARPDCHDDQPNGHHAVHDATQGEREDSTRTSDSDSYGEQPIDTDWIRTMLE
jgi:hypothetical protein